MLLCTLGLGLGATSAKAAFAPVVVTGFNQDVIANGSGTAVSSTTYDVDGSAGTGYCFMAPNFVNPAGLSPTSFLPANGLISSAATSGLTFQMASYSANNSLRLPLTGSGTTGTGTLTLATPQTAGEVYALVTSGGGVSTVTVTVTFTDGTTQVLAAQTVADWYAGANPVLLGLGRVGRDATSTIDNNTADPRLYQLRVPLLAANYTKLVQSVAFNKTSTTGVLNVFGISLNSVCSGAPTAGTAVSTAASVCAATSITLSLTGATGDVGIGYQWQASTDNGVTWTDITGATSATYTTSGLTATTLYRARVSCGTLSANSTAVTVSTATAVYATLPVTESFENTWVNGCNTRDVPSTFWRNTPATGNASWRRDDDGVAAAWTSPTSYIYSPVSSQGSHSARFHSGWTMGGVMGTLDLLVNLSPTGAKRLSFDFSNITGTDSLIVEFSANGGTTFSRLAGFKLSGTGFSNQVLPISSTSATSIIRFRGRGDYASNDIGLDNIILESATGCLTPAGLTATTATTTAALSWLTGGTGTYTVLYGPTGFNPALPSSATNLYTTVSALAAPPYNVTGLTPGTTYQFYVTLNCAAGASSGTAGPVAFTTQIVNDDPCGATLLPVTNTCTPLSTTSVGAGTTASTVYASGAQGTGCGTVTAPHDVWFSFTTAATGPTSTQVRISVTGGAASAVRAYSGTACAGPLTYMSCAGTAANTAAPNLDLLTLTPSTTYYIRVSEYSTTYTLGNFTICATPVPNCPAPNGLTATGLTNTTAVAGWAAVSGGTGSTYTVIYGPTGFSPTGGGTTLSGITGTSATLTGLAPTTAYQFYVQQICGGFNGSSTLTGPFSFTTPLTAPTNDEPCGAQQLTSGTVSGSNLGATTSVQNGINTPACAGGALPKDVWFAFTPSGTSTTLTFTGSAAGAVRIFTSPSCSAGPFSQVFCQGSGTANTALGAVPVTGLTAGTRYYVAVSGFGGSDATGSFTLAGTALLASQAQIESSALLVFPNPSNTGQLTVRLNGLNAAGQATLLNALGQKVLTKTLAAGSAEQTLTTRGLAPGLYTLRVQVGSDVLTRKVVLE
ncbi:fibronectin type III domain-containing protein [Hymenobacter terricola]|uniref:fibronectin type III domain-containing protein n=1 Tax=Hymenobacter terricola TaxID=2819236 RepID=UPI001B301C75|nr:fibronectin type III domain-containing protein [Hymenobacter terricola]